jgi:peptide/nickel transport system ATP-binding protein
MVEGEIPNPISPPSGCSFHPRCPLSFDRCSIDVPALTRHETCEVACHAVEAGRI